MKEKALSIRRPDLKREITDPVKSRYCFLLALLLLLSYFGYFVIPALRDGFASDDPINIHYYWKGGGGGSSLFKGLLIFFSTYYRPMVGFFLFTIYEVFGLNPFPYHVVITSFLLLNVFLSYRCAARLSNSSLVGGFAAMLAGYHAHMWNLVHFPAYLFDVICFTFFFSALLYYLRIRQTGRRLNKLQIAVLLLLYIGALEAKEMAVSLPVMLLSYELIRHWPVRPTQELRKWIWQEPLPSLLAGLITAIYILGKNIGPDALSKSAPYRPRFSWHQYYWTSVKFINQIFYQQSNGWIGMVMLFPGLAVLALIAWRLRQKALGWAIVFVLITPLPITFIPERGGALLYVTLFGWALMGAIIIVTVCRTVMARVAAPGLYRDSVSSLALMLCFISIWSATDYANRNRKEGIKPDAALTSSVIEQLTPILRDVKPGSKIAFMNNLFDGWNLVFIAELLCHDRSVTAKVNTMTPMSAEELAQEDYIFAFEDNKLVILKRP